MQTPDVSELPTTRQLLRATAIALVVALAILVTIVFPAEYGLDPTGIGARLGLFRPRAAIAVTTMDATDTKEGASSADDAPSSGRGLLRRTTPFRTDDMSLVLQPGEGAEIKARMARGERFVFTWTAEGGPVDVDMHGEAAGAKDDEATSYWKEEGRTSGHGAFEAPVAGAHGWFWQNLGAAPVTIKLKTSGFYDHLFQP